MSTLAYAASKTRYGNDIPEPFFAPKQEDVLHANSEKEMDADRLFRIAQLSKTQEQREAEKEEKRLERIKRLESGETLSSREISKRRIDEAQAVIHFNYTGGRELSPEQQRTRWNRIRHQIGLDESDTAPQPVGFGEYLGDASWKGFKERLPVAGDVKEMKDMWAVYRAANRAAQNKATDEDLETIADFYEDQAYSSRDMTVAGRALNIFSQMPTFASEMAIAAGLTAAMGSGVGTAPAAAASAEIVAAKAGKKVAKEAAKKALEKVVFKNLARQAGIGLLEGGVVLPLVKSGKVAADTLEGMMPTSRVYKDEQGNIATEKVADGENVLPALAKSFYRQSVEGVTEKMGGPIDRVLGSALRKAGISSKTLEAYLGKPGTSVAKLNKAFKLGGIDSVVSELLEERIGEVLMAPIDGYELPSGKQLASEALAFSVPGLAKQAIGRGIQATRWGKSQLLTPEGAAEFVREHPEAAAKLAESKTPSRAVVEELVESGAVEPGNWSADERTQASGLTREAIEANQESAQEEQVTVEPEDSVAVEEGQEYQSLNENSDEAFSLRPGHRVPSSGSSEQLPSQENRKADYSAEPTTWVEAPEMLKLAEAVAGNQALVRKLEKGKQGVFRKGRIFIDPKIAGDPVELAKVLAHEIGHLVDWAKDFIGNTLLRGNLLGRLLSLKNFGREFHAEIGASDSAIRNELQALSQWWEPFNRAKDPAYTKYRDQPKELYADAISVMLNNPDALLERAPKFHKAFFEHLDKKPDVKEAFEALRKMLTGPPEAIQDARIDDMLGGFSEAKARKQDAEEAREARKPSILDNFLKAVISKAALIKKDLRGNPTPQAVAVRNALAAMRHTQTAISHFMNKVRRQVTEPISKAGLNEDDLGLYQTLKRIMTGRKDDANPYGQNESTASDTMARLQQRLGEEKFGVLEKAAEAFQELTFEIVTKAYEAGLISEKLYNEVIVPNKDNYVTFRTIDHVIKNMPADIKKTVGTFKKHENPFVTTMMKMMSMQNAIDLNNAKTALRDFYQKEFVGTMVRVKENESGEKPTSPRPGFKFTTIMENGKPIQYEVDGYIVDAISKHEISDLERLVRVVGKVGYGIFHPLYVTFSAGFQLMNPGRDSRRTMKNLAAASREGENFAISSIKDLARLPKTYAKSIRSAWRYAGNEYDPTIEDMLEHRAIFAALASRDFDVDDSTRYEKQLLRHKLMGEKEKTKTRKIIGGAYAASAGRILGFLERSGNTLETMSKVAAWNLLQDSGMSKEDIAEHVRSKSGTPDYTEKGTATGILNSLWMYFNVNIQGMATDWSIATNPKTAGGYWMRSVMVDFIPTTIKIGAAYGLFGPAVQHMMGLIPDYDKLKYHVIPLGTFKDERTGKTKTRYIRQPFDDVNRPLCGILWELSKGKDAKITKMISTLFGELPNQSPVLSIGSNWLSLAMGQNPKDYFRGRDILSRDAYNAGGMPAIKEMARWTGNQFGVLSTLGYSLVGDPKQLARETSWEKFVKSIPGLDRLIKETDAGRYESIRDEQQEEASEKSRRKMALDDLTRSHMSRRYSLSMLGKENLSPYDRREKTILDGFNKSIYTPITKAINTALDNGREEEAKRLRSVLKSESKRIQGLIENSGK